MLVLGLLLLAAGVLAIVAAVVGTSGTASFLGADLGSATIFFVGLGAGLAVLWGLSLTRIGARRSWRQRRETRQLRQHHDRETHAAEPSGDDASAG